MANGVQIYHFPVDDETVADTNNTMNVSQVFFFNHLLWQIGVGLGHGCGLWRYITVRWTERGSGTIQLYRKKLAWR